ncbi:MAG: DUF3052 domain-containing protein [Bacteroidota bacterium]
MSASGYSTKPLYQKIGVKEEHRVVLIDAPYSFMEWLDVPFSLQMISAEEKADYCHIFVKEKELLRSYLPEVKQMIHQHGMIWVSWPKKAAKVVSDVTEGTIRELALPMDLVDVKVCSVSDIWSGLKLMIRKEKRV